MYSSIHVLLDAFDQVTANGTPRLVLVCGQPGIGKSSVINELHRALVPSRGLFACGKFDKLERDVPFASLADPLRGLIVVRYAATQMDKNLLCFDHSPKVTTTLPLFLPVST